MTVAQVMKQLEALRRQRSLAGGVRAAARRRPSRPRPPRTGLLPVTDLRKMARRLGQAHDTARGLWATGCRDARALATMVDQPWLVDDSQLDHWIQTAGDPFVADRVCLELVVRTPWARSKVGDWAHHPQPLVRRAAYVLLAALARTDRQMTDADFIPWVDVVPSSLPREDGGVRRAMLRALSAIASRNEALQRRVLGASARLRHAAPAGGDGRPPSASSMSLAWRLAG